MNTELFKILAVLITAAVCSVLLKPYRPEYAFAVTAGAAACSITLLINLIFPRLEQLKTLFEKSGNVPEYFSVALKAIAIAYVCEFAAETCRDFGQSALASKAELAGKCAIFILCVPLMCAVVETALGFAGV